MSARVFASGKSIIGEAPDALSSRLKEDSGDDEDQSADRGLRPGERLWRGTAPVILTAAGGWA